MEEKYFKLVMTSIIFIVLVVLSFLLLRPLLISIIVGVVLAFVFLPLFHQINKIFKVKNVSALIMCLLLLVVIILPIWYLAPIAIDQSIKFYLSSQQMDLITPFKTVFPSLFQTETFSAEIGSAIQSFVTKSTNALMNSFSNFILNFPRIFLQFLVVFFTFFFVLRDSNKLVSYIKSLLPFSKDVITKLFHSSKSITMSILYGQVVVGIIQGIITGTGFFLFKVPNALLLTVLAAVAGIFPIIGTAIVWIPVAIYFFLAGNTFSAFGIIIFGLISTVLENFIKPVFVSKRTKVNTSIILIGMIGGLFMFGLLGVILGPLILAYLLIILEIFRNKKIPGIFIEEPEKGATSKKTSKI
jgi:predicted PurR-regulated permease PerM